MRPEIALGVRLLLHDRRRLFAMAASIAVGVVIMFVELGLFQAILDAQALVARLTRGELMVMNQARVDLHRWDTIPAFELAQIAAVPGVAAVIPVYEDHVGVTDPDGRRVRRIILFAFPPDTLPLAIGDPKTISAELRGSNGLLFDARSRPIFGKIKPHMNIDIDRAPVEVTGLVEMGPDIVNDGAVFMSEGEWRGQRPNASPIMGVIRLSPGARLDEVRRAIYAQTAPDIVVLTPGEAAWREAMATLKAAPIGVLFGVGVLAGLVIGAVNAYQVLFASVNDQLKQFATLKAIGFSDAFLHRVVMAEAMALSAAGFAVGLIAAMLLDAYVAALTRLPVGAHPLTGALVAAGTLAACVMAGRLALRRVDAADPASLY